MEITWRKALVIVSVAFALLDSSCIFDQNPDCKYKTPYSKSAGVCNDDILYFFTEMPLGKDWLMLDSLQNGQFLNFYDSSAFYKTLRVAKADFNIYLDIYFTEVRKESVCMDCPTQVKLANRSCFYKINNETIITLKTNRENTKMPNYSENDWPEYIEISTLEYGNLNHIPGKNVNNYKRNKLIPSLTINGKLYSNVIYVYDSLLMNNIDKSLVEAYYTSSFGLIKYTFSNGEVWSLK